MVVGDLEVLAARVRAERLLVRPGPAAEARAAFASRVGRERPDAHAAEHDAERRLRGEPDAAHHEPAVSSVVIDHHDGLTPGVRVHAGRLQRALDVHARARIHGEQRHPNDREDGARRPAPLRPMSPMHVFYLLSLAPAGARCSLGRAKLRVRLGGSQ